jgi:predicted transcriptional regulator
VIQIKIISGTPGLSTREQILAIIQARNTGITIKEISKIINRPVSMIQVCLKDLISSKDIFTHQNKVGIGLIYYPINARLAKRG